jgi:hypothetical protein
MPVPYDEDDEADPDEVEQMEREQNTTLLASFLLGAPIPGKRPGATDGVFDDPKPDSVAPTQLEMESLVHWSTGEIMCRANEETLRTVLRNPLFDGVGPFEQISVDTAVDVLCASGYLEALSMDRSDLACLVTAADPDWDIPTPGCWFYVDLHDYTAKRQEQQLFYESGNPGSATVAYHGTSLSSACLILADGFRPGPNVTAGRVGVYFEGTARRLCTLNYAVHEHVCVPRTYPLHQFCCILECLVDRSRGRTVHRQWCQPPGTFMVDGMYLHCFDMKSLLKPNFFGWFRCHSASLKHLAEATRKEDIKTSWELQQEIYQQSKEEEEQSEGRAAASAHDDDSLYQ